jgi:IS5 family transposase
MDAVIPWARLVGLIAPHYPKAGNGRQPLGLEKMLRIYFLQQWFNLSDPQAEDAVYDSESMRRFAGVELGEDVVPDETTILRFRHLLEQHQLTAAIFREIGGLLAEKRLILKAGTIVDATIITAPSSTTPDYRPVVTWTFTPAALPAGEASTAQKAWRAWLEQLVGGVWRIIADSGLVTGPDLTWSPATSLTNLAASYRARVQIADALTREANVSASNLAEQLVPFTFAPGGGVGDPTGLTATVVDGYSVRFDFSRATRPDHWAVEVDGVLALDGVDVTPTGTAYAFTFYGLRPRIAHTVKLHAVELLGAAFVASPGASVSVTTDPRGIWLVDPSTGEDVQLAGDDELQASIGETAEVYERLGEQAPVVVTELVRGDLVDQRFARRRAALRAGGERHPHRGRDDAVLHVQTRLAHEAPACLRRLECDQHLGVGRRLRPGEGRYPERLREERVPVGDGAADRADERRVLGRGEIDRERKA